MSSATRRGPFVLPPPGAVRILHTSARILVFVQLVLLVGLCGGALIATLEWPHAVLRLLVALAVATHRNPSLTTWFVAALALSVPLHEIAHGIVMRLGGARVSYGVRWWYGLPLAAYCQPDRALSRRWLMASLAAPQVLVPAVALLVGTLWSPFGPIAWAVVACNAIGGVGDLMAARAVLGSRYEAFLDTLDGLYGLAPAE